MGIIPPLQKFDIPSSVQGAAMQAYYGGRAECRIRHTEVPVVLVDFLSQYASVNVLMGLWWMLIAERLQIVECIGAEIERFLESVTLDKTFDQEFWKSVTFFALVRPSETVLPVRADYNTKTPNIGVNPLTSEEPIWYAGPDIVAAKLQDGRTPEVIRGFRVVAEGQQNGLQSVTLRSAVEVDPTTEDFFRKIVEARGQVKADNRLPKLEREAISYFLKILASAGSYGLFVEVNPENVADRAKLRVLSGEADFETSSLVIEPPGRWYCPVFGALITAAGRLLLTQLECCVRNEGGSYLFCDTDSMGAVASADGGLVACEGGPYSLPDGRAAIKALTLEQVNRIVMKFELLNPYDSRFVQDCLLKVEDVNFSDGILRGLFGWAIAAKRYALFTRTAGGGLHIAKASAHGLGFLYHPRRKDDPIVDTPTWVLEAWDWILRGALHLPRTEPLWFQRPAMMRVAITTPEVLMAFQARQTKLPYRDRAKPANFALMPILDEFDGYPVGSDPERFTLIAPFTSDEDRWYRLKYLNIHDGKLHRLASADRKRPYEAGAKTWGGYVAQYRWHPEAKSLAPDGEPCSDRTYGLLRRTPVTAVWPPVYIGKETDRRWEQAEDISIVEWEGTVYTPNETEKLVADIGLAFELREFSNRILHRASNIAIHTIQAAKRGGRIRRSTAATLRKALLSMAETH